MFSRKLWHKAPSGSRQTNWAISHSSNLAVRSFCGAGQLSLIHNECSSGLTTYHEMECFVLAGSHIQVDVFTSHILNKSRPQKWLFFSPSLSSFQSWIINLCMSCEKELPYLCVYFFNYCRFNVLPTIMFIDRRDMTAILSYLHVHVAKCDLAN